MNQIKAKLYTTDINTLLLFNSSLKCRILDRLMPKLTHIGSAIITVTLCFVIAIFGKGEIRKSGVQALAALILSHLLVRVLKNSVCRLRPKDVVPNLNTFNISIDYYSFPSGHTTAVFAIAATLAMSIPATAFTCFPIAVLVGISRMYLGVHYPSDVLAGVALAVITSIIINSITNFL